MRVLYYAPEYYARHGGRTHATHFFEALSRDSRVSRAVIFPEDSGSGGLEEHAPESGLSSGAGRSVLRHVHRMLPSVIRQQADILAPSPSTYASLSAVFVRERPDAAVLRLGARFRYVGRLKRDHPAVRLCVEYNSSPFDESLRGILAEDLWRHEEVTQLSKADCVSAVADHLRRYLVSMCPALESRVFVNPNGADPDVFMPPDSTARARARREMGIPSNAFVLGYAGGMEEWRRVPEIVSWTAAARRAGFDELFLVLLGSGRDLGRVLQTIECEYATLCGRVYCSGEWLASSEVSALMAAFDAGVLSFQYARNCSQKAFEYLACGLPVIAPMGSIPDAVAGRACGTYEFGGDFSGFLTTVRHVYTHPEQCRASALRGREVVQREFTWAANASRVVAALE